MNLKKIDPFTLAVFLLLPTLIFYLCWGTGLHSDDYNNVRHWLKSGFDSGYLKMIAGYIPSASISALAFKNFQFTPWPYDILKFLSNILFFSGVLAFMRLYFEKWTALYIAFLATFLPNHDAINYWFTGNYILQTLGVLFWAFVLIEKNKKIRGHFLNTLGAFYSYASPPLSWSFVFLLMLEKKFKKAIVFAIPHIIYIIYYKVITSINGTMNRVDSGQSKSLFKSLFIQVGSFLDSGLGPSHWLKTYYSILELEVISGLITLVIIAVLMLKFVKWRPFLPPANILLWSISLLALGLGMFALTGRYPQLAFNLGNRVSIYGCFVIIFIILLLIQFKPLRPLILIISIAAPLGLSQHWKSWSQVELGVIAKIKDNSALKSITADDLILVKNNLYSRLGPFSHIEFLAEDLNYVLLNQFSNDQIRRTFPYSNRIVRKDQGLFDSKYKVQMNLSTQSNLAVFDSLSGDLEAITLDQFVPPKQKTVRHWIQLLKGTFVANWVTQLAPQYQYLFR